jgi:enterochelin esterase-like enzyme
MTNVVLSTTLVAGLAPAAHALQGTLVTPLSFVGPVTGKTVVFSLYLPPGYAGGTTRYPVVYHLHGKASTHSSSLQVVAQSHEAAVAAGRIGPVILVFPDGGGDSFWADSVDGTRPIETNVVAELLPYVDANYRTHGTRDQRAVQGFSMGGFGAAKFAAKFPHLFAAGLLYDGALVTWSGLLTYHASIASAMFANSESAFDLHSPWYWVTENAAALEGSVPFRQVAGTEKQSNRNFRTHLQSNGITPEYVETTCGHQITCVLDAGGADSWSFLARAMGDATPTPTPTLTPTPTRTPTPTVRPRVRPRPRATRTPTATAG